MPAAAAKANKDKVRVPLKLRLKAWWEGYDPRDIEEIFRRQLGSLADTDRAESSYSIDRPSSEVNPDDPELPFDPWDKNRVEIAQYIWGEGYCGPGGPEHIISMSKLLALSPEMSMVEIGSGLGGPTRTLCDHFGVWITGHEQSERLAELANEKSTMAGLAKKAAVKHFDPDQIEEFNRRFDRAFAKESLVHIENKKHIISLVEEYLKPSGLFLITDYVLGGDSTVAKQEYKTWKEHEKQPVFPVTSEELVEFCKDARFNVRVSEDITDQYSAMINHAWAGADKVVAKLTKQEDGPALIQTLLREAEYWQRRVKLMESGDLKVWRVLASKKGEKPSMMSNW